ncbi:MAG: hypothetical protein RIT81_20850 [Deltaproteobacteria bacterium]
MRSEIVAVLFVSACTASPTRSATAPAPPEDVTHVLAVARGDDVFASAVVRREDREEVGAELPEAWDRAAEAWILGFTDDELDHLGLVPTAEPARAAGEFEPLLAPPGWQVHGIVADGSVTLAADGVAPPSLTVAGLPPCPQIYGPDSYADFRCRPRPCVAPIVQDGCRITIDELACELGVDGTLDGRGRPTFAARCETTEEGDAPRAEITCEDPPAADCPIHLYDGLETIAVRVETATVYDVEATPIDDAPWEDAGFVGGLAVLQDSVVAAGYRGAPLTLPCPDLESELVFFDRDDLSRIGDAPIGRCVREIVASEDRTTIFGLVGTNPGVRFVELDAEGNLLREVARDPGWAGPTEYGRIVLTGGYAVFLEHFIQETLVSTENVVAVDLSTFTFSETTLPQEPMARPMDVYPSSPGRVLVADVGFNRIVEYDVGAQSFGDQYSLCGGAKNAESLFVEGRVAYALGVGVDSVLSVIDLATASSPCVLARYFVNEANTRLPLGFAGGRLWVAAHAQGEPAPLGRAQLFAYDPAREAFVPGSVDLGAGLPTTGVQVDGAFYVVLAWSGRIVRVTDL